MLSFSQRVVHPLVRGVYVIRVRQPHTLAYPAKVGGTGGTRTPDRVGRNHLLYPLSYDSRCRSFPAVRLYLMTPRFQKNLSKGPTRN